MSQTYTKKNIRDYYMAFFFISHPTLARGHCNSIHEPIGSRTHIQWPRANIGCDINTYVMILISYIYKKQYQRNIKNVIRCMIIINILINVYLYKRSCQFAPAVCISCGHRSNFWRLTQTSKFSDANRTLRHNSRWLTEWGVK